MANKLIIGSHASLKAPGYFLSSVHEMLSYGANTMMIYSGAPQNTKRVPLEELKIEEGKKELLANGIKLEHLIMHAPYIINLASKKNKESYEFAKKFLLEEIKRAEAFGINVIVLHQGNALDLSLEEAIKNLTDALNEIFELYPSETKIAIESMAGKGTEIGKTLDELALILSLIKDKSRVGICLDTCHLHDAGYDLANASSFLHLVNEKIGLENVLVIHLNDSKNERGARKDRHENIGYGYIGFNTLYEYVYHPLLTDIPKILETPYIDEKPPYKEEIAMIKNKVFNKMLK